MKKELLSAVKRGVHQVGFALDKNSHTILLVAGLATAGVGMVMACKASTKASAILEEAKKEIETVHMAKDTFEGVAEEDGTETYSELDYKKDLAIVYFKTTKKFVKLYAPSAAVMTLSVASILLSHRILSKRNFALAAANTAITTGFQTYRNRVIEKLGQAVDQEFLYGTRTEKIETEVTDENGNTKKTKAKELVVDGDATAFTRILDRRSGLWDESFEIMDHSLHQVEEYVNDILNSRATNHKKGTMTFNDILRELRFHDEDGNIEQTCVGMVLGYTADKNERPFSLGCWDENGRLKKAKRKNESGQYETVVLLDMSKNITDIYHSGLLSEK